MIKKIWEIYKIQLLATLTLIIVIISVKVLKSPIHIFITSLAALLGTFVLELDYFVYAYFLEPEKTFSKTLRGFVEHKDIARVINHIYYAREEVKEKTLNSVLFQIALAGTSIFVASSTSSLFIKSLILSTFANSIYKMADYYFEDKLDQWFWALKKIPNKNGVLVYGLVMLAVLVYSITLI